MAARENQGLQIALIVFVTLTVLLSLTTFVFFRNYQNEQQARKSADETAGKATADRSRMEGERRQLMQWVGYPETEKIETVEEGWKKDMAAYEPLLPAKLPDDQKTYKKLSDGLNSVVRAQHAQLEKKDADLNVARANFEQKTKDYGDELKKLTDDKERALKEYMDARTQMKTDVDKLTETKTQLNTTLGEKEKEYSEQKKQLDTRIVDLDDKLKKTKNQLLLRADDVNKMSMRFSVSAQPDGRIVLVNSRDNVVYINLGSDDRLHKRITFSVFDPTTTDVGAVKTKKDVANPLDPSSPPTSQAKRKGVIEVINITQPHMAECRILENPSSNPLLPGDLIYTPLWDPGQQEHFALVGFLDIDGDGVSDRQKIHDLIRTRGGLIDAESDEKGNVQGGITYATRFLVEGDMNEREGLSKTGPHKLIDDAKDLGVEVVDLAKFLDMMAYSPAAAALATATGRTPQPSLPGQPDTNFRTRIPPERGNKGGAY